MLFKLQDTPVLGLWRAQTCYMYMSEQALPVFFKCFCLLLALLLEIYAESALRRMFF